MRTRGGAVVTGAVATVLTLVAGAPIASALNLTPAPGSPVPIRGNYSSYSLAFNPSGSLLAVANLGGNREANEDVMYSVSATGRLVPVPGSPFAAGGGPVSVAFSPDGSLLATADQSGSSLSLSSVSASGALTPVSGSPFNFGLDTHAPDALAYNPDGHLIAMVGAGGNSIATFSVLAGAVAPVSGSPFSVWSPSGGGYAGSTSSFDPVDVAFSPNGAFLATANILGDSVSVFSVDAAGALTPVAGSPFETGSSPGADPDVVAFSPSGDLLAVANQTQDSISVFAVDGSGRVTQVPGSPFPTGAEHGDIVLSAAFSPDGSMLAVANTSSFPNASASSIALFAVSAAGALAPVAGSPFHNGVAYPTALAFSPNGQLLAMTHGGPTAGVSVLSLVPTQTVPGNTKPSGTVERLRCDSRAPARAGSTPIERCTATAVRGPVQFSSESNPARATLAHGGTVIAQGTAATVRGHLEFASTSAVTVARGTYTLHIVRRGGRRGATVTTRIVVT